MMRSIFIFSIFAFIVSTVVASAPSFCKCTCFTNSTIIELPHSSNPPALDNPPRAAAVGCSACNKAFCLTQRLPICKNAEEKDVLTTCFQRDSRKDQIVVLTFITGTVGLLVTAAVKKLLAKRDEHGVRIEDTQRGYTAVGR